MRKIGSSVHLLLIILVTATGYTCGNTAHPPHTDLASTPEQLNEKAAANLRKQLDYATTHDGMIRDSLWLNDTRLLLLAYQSDQFSPYWCRSQVMKPAADSLLQLIRDARLYGLFPEDYHQQALDSIVQRFSKDSMSKTDRKDAALWARADLLLTDAFIRVMKNVKFGRLPQDSISQRKDSVLPDSFYLSKLKEITQGASLSQLITSLEPQHDGYHLLKAGIKKFLDNAQHRKYTKVPPSKSPGFRLALQKRLFEGGYIAFDSVQADSAQLAAAVKKFQQQKNITVDGMAGEGTIRMLNTTDTDRFMSIVITLDRYKHLPEKMPAQYVWVNLPSFQLHVQDGDSVKLISKIVCGKAATRTPVLTSGINEIITYPQWTVPQSIIAKEILPAVKRNPGYLTKKGFSLVDSKGNEVDPSVVDWTKYKKGIPYRVVQGSGDANALGVLKFNFPNKYAVYLHDTNQRYLFGVPVRTLSHGCVRVQEWKKLAEYIIRKDRPEIQKSQPVLDSLDTWLARKEKRSIAIHNRLPVFIRYFTSEGKKNEIVFYDDIYGEDKSLREKYYKGK